MRPLLTTLLTALLLACLPLQLHAQQLSAEGYGQSITEARESALQELSQMVIAAVASDMESITRLDGGEVTDTIENRLRIQSSSYFQGVSYSEPQRVDGSYRVRATLSTDAARRTAEHLLREIRVDLNTLSRHELLSLQDQAVFLMAFAAYVPESTTLSRNSLINEAGSIRQNIFRYLNFARITFELEPRTAVVRLGDEQLQSGEMRLVAPGNYQYQVTAADHHTLRNQLFLSAGEQRRINLALVPLRTGSVALQLINSSDQALLDEARRVFGSYNIQYATTSPQVIRLEVQQQLVTEISGIKVYNLRMVAEARKGNDVVLVRRASQNNVVEAQVDSRLRAITRALVQAILSSPEAENLW
ncbi:hypothetical protein [Marinospirillum alkaliphilum]|uniref:LPP20 lipoprotein n=1 Tax=Marinospirillum alkaliphilum DSM 21637 TaxID=1122209 RepID=A0A1K1XIL4_9GAMM|nr:hypothetical protein [Marinospirillum alkaliphilum]SFX49554.1 hypothetical protein SAMN02745752_01861 [Marinospirillum alkaliphilum DSM 21637]